MEAALAGSEIVLEGETKMGGQVGRWWQGGCTLGGLAWQSDPCCSFVEQES